jgi:ABC-2 type transport system ATP-binding protein
MQDKPSLAIKVQNLTKEYSDLVALSNVSFEVQQGEIFGLLGPNGAGKTTTINILTTLLKPTSGSATILGEDVLKNPKTVRKQISLVLQAGSLNPFLNVFNNLYFCTLLQRIHKAERIRRIEKIMEELDLTSKRKTTLFQLSGGQYRRLQIASAFLYEKAVLFLDEPTLGIDIEGKIKIWKLLKERKKERNLTVFLATNDMAEAEFLCDRIAFVSQGIILAVDTPEILKREAKTTLLIVDYEMKSIEDIHLSLPPQATILSKENYRIQISLNKVDGSLASIIQQINEQAVIKDIDLRKPSLQDVFIYLTKVIKRE